MTFLKIVTEVIGGTALTGYLIFNGLMMTFAPKRWLSLPGWIATKGTLAGADGDDLWTSIQIRGMGLAIICFCLYAASILTNGFMELPHFRTE